MVYPVAGAECATVLPWLWCHLVFKGLVISRSLNPGFPMGKIKMSIPLQGRGLLHFVLVSVLPRRAEQRPSAELVWRLRWRSYKTHGQAPLQLCVPGGMAGCSISVSPVLNKCHIGIEWNCCKMLIFLFCLMSQDPEGFLEEESVCKIAESGNNKNIP